MAEIFQFNAKPSEWKSVGQIRNSLQEKKRMTNFVTVENVTGELNASGTYDEASEFVTATGPSEKTSRNQLAFPT